ncbi:MAG: squalene/phytoene synthase family protein [Anaerolineae bacterium]|jgi:farnesyl-diphosphate farnesyltransferase
MRVVRNSVSVSTTLRLTRSQEEYLSTLMDMVSRSFAVVVACLEEPLDYSMATAYLICRVVDNIEDCEQPPAWQHERFAEFLQLLNEPGLATDILSRWGREAWPGLSDDERRMMDLPDGAGLWHIYALLPASTRDTIARWVTAMVEGMQQITDPGQAQVWVRHHGVQVLNDEAGYNRYCYYVAGTVGHLASELVINHYQITGPEADRLLKNCEACGRGLQKTNIVKDFVEDLDRGICYLPDTWMREVDFSPLSLSGAPAGWKQDVLNNVLEELRDSTDYVLALPDTAVGYRLASLMCLLPAYQTLLLAAQNHWRLFTVDHQVKISRETFLGCLQDAQLMLTDNDAIIQYSRHVEYAVARAFNGSTHGLVE